MEPPAIPQSLLNDFEAAVAAIREEPAPSDAVARALFMAGVTAASCRLTLTYGGLELDSARRLVVCDGAKVPLSQREWELLLYLVKNADRVISEKELLSSVWGTSKAKTSNIVDVFVSVLRRKHPLLRRMICTITSAGYGVFAEPPPGNRPTPSSV